jgi:hypothetical protein
VIVDTKTRLDCDGNTYSPPHYFDTPCDKVRFSHQAGTKPTLFHPIAGAADITNPLNQCGFYLTRLVVLTVGSTSVKSNGYYRAVELGEGESPEIFVVSCSLIPKHADGDSFA